MNRPTKSLKHVLGLLVLLLLCGVAIAPLLRDDIPCTHDGGLHYYRVVAMRQALRHGILYTRYLPDLAFGYGFPFFNYRAPVSYYLTLAFFLVGLSLPTAMKLVYVVSIAGSALTAYLLARDLFGPRAGLISAIAYAYAPYQFLNALTRGNAPESLALPLLPLILWAFRRLALTGDRRWFLVSIGSLATLYLTHNISSLLFTPLLVAYLCALWWVYRQKGYWILTAAALGLALGLAAFFLAPALLEKGYVHLDASRGNRNNDFHYNFVGLAEILAPPKPVDTALINPPILIHLGLAPVILAAIALIVGLLRQRDPERRVMLSVLALAAIVMVGMSTAASVWIWETLPLISFVQFPWRFIGRAALPVALLAGAAFASQPTQNQERPTRRRMHTTGLLLLASCVLILAAFPATYPVRGFCQGDPDHPTIYDLFAYEHRPGGLVGADPTGSYFPSWVKQKPKGSPLEEQYSTGEPVARFDATTLPQGAKIVEAGYGPNRAHVTIDTPARFRARYLAFYFPGWRVSIDDRPVEIIPTDPEGLTSFDVPAGQHTIDVRFGETPLRLAFDIISLLSLATLVTIAICYPRIPSLQSPAKPASVDHPRVSFHWSLLIPLFLAALLLLFTKLAIVDRIDTPFRRPGLQPGTTLRTIQHPLSRPYTDGMLLMGYNQDRETMPADGVLRVDLYLSAYRRPTARYQSVIHLVGPDGMRWSAPDSFRPRGYVEYAYTTIWSPGVYALDSHEVEPLSGTPPGTYDVVLTIFDKDTLAPLSVLNDSGQPAAPELTLGQVTLTRPRQTAALPEKNRIDLDVGDMTLLTAGFDRDQAAPGDSVHVTLMWRADYGGYAISTHSHKVVTLVAGDGTEAVVYPLLPPAGRWEPGDVLRSQHMLVLPATLESGEYTWGVRLTAFEIGQPIAQITVDAPPHVYEPPTFAHAVGTTLGQTATLIGFDLAGETKPGSTLAVGLVWRAEQTPDVSYRVFVHLLDVEGRIVAQSDAVPAGWARPTTGWLPGEYIVDDHSLAIPADTPAAEYQLTAGVYAPDGERLTDPDGSDAIPVMVIAVETQ